MLQRTPKKSKLLYNFIDKDPIIDKLRTLIARSGMTYAQVAEVSGVTVQTLYNWFRGPTRKPQYATIMAVVLALGYTMAIVKKGRRS